MTGGVAFAHVVLAPPCLPHECGDPFLRCLSSSCDGGFNITMDSQSSWERHWAGRE